ncbi:MAG: hypothetical protein AAF570_26725, partial [Bacteroidota bacterium]
REFRVALKEIRNEYYPQYPHHSVVRIEIWNCREGERIQTIYPQDHGPIMSVHSSSSIFAVEDMNFDGELDFRLMLGAAINGGYRWYDYYIFDTTRNRYVKNMTMDDISEPYFDADLKLVHAYLRVGFSSFWHALYKWDGMKVKLLVEETEFWDDPYPMDSVYQTTEWTETRWKRNGRWRTYRNLTYMHNGPHGHCDLYWRTVGFETAAKCHLR